VNFENPGGNEMAHDKKDESKSAEEDSRHPLSILGGGPGGLAVGFYARKRSIPFTIYEEAHWVGGNCITLQHGDFFFDSGAHRFHDKIPEVTEEIKELMGDDLKKVSVPSQIYYRKKFVDFPLSPLNLIKNLGLFTFFIAGLEVLRARMWLKEPEKNFEKFALYTYGKIIANLFLLNYSEKLWGAPCNQLSRNISGNRMKGLNLKTFLREAILGGKAKTEHLDGSFYYPKRGGIGCIMDRLEEFCGKDNIQTKSRVDKILHNHNRIEAIEINGKEVINTYNVVSTLPISYLLKNLEPPPPKEIVELAGSLHFRNMVLVAIFLDMESVTSAATIYFPGRHFLFTRLYEPNNRNTNMSPPEKTSLIMEIPCQNEDDLWAMKDDELIHLVSSQLIEIGLIHENKILDAEVVRMKNAYPLLELGFEEKIKVIYSYLKSFENLRISGRNGKFLYTHIHDMIKFGKEIVDEYPFR
jgi:protoporphyrinogen oxidase